MITHVKRLRRSDVLLADFVTRMRGLGCTLGPILFQLPDGLPRDTGLLRNFLDMLPRDLAYAFEFRDPSWFRDRSTTCSPTARPLFASTSSATARRRRW